MNHDPIDELARRLFAAARDERPDDVLMERVERARQPSVTALHRSRAADPPHSGVRESAALPGPRLRARWLLAAAALGLVAMVGRLMVEAPTPPPTISAEGHTRLSGRAQPTPDAVPSLATPPRETAALDTPTISRPKAAPVAASPPAPMPRPAAPRSAVSDKGSAVADQGNVAPATADPSPPASMADPSALAAPQPPAPPPSGSPALLAELNLLKQARAAVRSGKHQTALTLLDRHATELHGTALTTEATLLRIEALSALGRHEQASTLAHRFVAENPNSPLVDRAQQFIDQPNRDGPR